MNVTTLVCFALKEEAGPFRRMMANRTDVAVLISGIGVKNADRAVREYLRTNSPRLVLTSGFAGGLNPEFSSGTIVFSSNDTALSGTLTVAGAKPAKFFCASKIATTVPEKQELRRTSGADAVEMESEAIHTVCREHRIPCATVRVISDTASEDLPLDFNKLAKPDLNLHYGKLAAAILQNPSKIAALFRLRKNCKFAAQRLADVLVKVVSP